MNEFDLLDKRGQKKEPYVCSSCGNCTMVCPVFNEMQWEQYGPRGKLSVMKLIFEGNAKFDDEFARKIFKCSLCEHCASVCTTSIQLDRFWEVTRAEALKAGLLPAPIRDIRDSMLRYGDPFRMGSKNRLVWADEIEDEIESHIMKKSKIAYFAGCNATMKYQLHGIPESMVKIMNYAGVDFTILGENEVCCGAPLVWSGDLEAAPEMAKQNTDLMRELGVETIVFSCPSCINTWRTVYRDILGVSVAKEFELLTTSQFIRRLNEEGKLSFEEQPMLTVTFHDPCVSARRLNVTREPRDVIERIPGVYNVEMVASEKNTRCCGNHGLLTSVDPLMASRIAERRLRDVSVTPASMLVTECPRCKLAFDLATTMSNFSIELLDIAELVARCLKERKE